jgi:hypothetical protein
MKAPTNCIGAQVVLRGGLEAIKKTFCTYRSGDDNNNIQVVGKSEVERFPE